MGFDLYITPFLRLKSDCLTLSYTYFYKCICYLYVYSVIGTLKGARKTQ
jgi:hypothetical protein